MQEADSVPIDWDDLKARTREAIRAVIQERADEVGISYDAWLDRYFPPNAAVADRPSDAARSSDAADVSPPASSR
jgi:hypothetical protein